MRNNLTDAAKKAAIEDTPAAMFAFLIERVRANLHIVLGMSPVGEPFRFVSLETGIIGGLATDMSSYCMSLARID